VPILHPSRLVVETASVGLLAFPLQEIKGQRVYPPSPSVPGLVCVLLLNTTAPIGVKGIPLSCSFSPGSRSYLFFASLQA
jgi:hypothetical protein